MFIKLTKSGPRRYVQLVESYRDPTGRTRQRTVASLGRLEQVECHVESMVRGLLRVTGREGRLPAPGRAAPAIAFSPARALGDVWSLTALWRELGFDALADVFGRTRRRIDVEALLRILVFNRLCDPESKLGVLRWLETVSLPQVKVKAVEHQHLLHAMDALIDHREEVDALTASLLRPLIDQALSIVYYDLTTISTAGLSEQAGELRRFGKNKDGTIKRQFVLGVVQTGEGLPIFHEVFPGNVAEVSTLKSTLQTVLERFPIKRVIAVADRGLLSTDNLAELQAMRLPNGRALEFILAVPGRRYGEFAHLLEPFHRQHCANAKGEVVSETTWNGLRLVIAHDPEAAAEQAERRNAQIGELEAKAAAWVEKLNGQDAGRRARGKPLSDAGACARFYHEVVEARLAKIIRVDLDGELFSFHLDERAKASAERLDGKLLLVTNATALKPREVVLRYQALAEVERSFRVLKSEIEIGPVYHRLARRIRAHAYVCFLALIVHRVLRLRLRASDTGLSPERALEALQRVQHHRVDLNGKAHSGITRLSDDQAAILAALGVKKPGPAEPLTRL